MNNNYLKNQTSTDAVEEIKNRLDIVDTVSEQVVLKKSGKNYWGLCPFHKEKTPSFSVNEEKGIYKCFGCGAGGDAISFIMNTQNISFWETMVILAQKFNIELPSAGVSSEKTELKKQILEVNKEAVNYYKKLLLESDEAAIAREYLFKRDMKEEAIEKFNLGFAPGSFDALMKHLLSKKYKTDLLLKAGLISEKSSGTGHLDRFRGRIMIPIQDEKGDFIAFGARALADNQNPKYLNSSDSLVFNKSRSLFALYQAKEAIKEQDSIILMEGFFDVISAHLHGLTNVVATLGTALTEQHIKIIARYSGSRRIYLGFDSDEAGVNATNRGAEIIKSAFSGLGEIKHFDESFADSLKDNSRTACEIRVLTTPTGKDPDEFLRTKGVEAYKQIIENAPLLIDHQINRIINSRDKEDTPQNKAKSSQEVIPLLSDINNSIIRNEYIKLVANRLNIEEESLSIEVKKSLQKVTSIQKKPESLPVKKNEDKRLSAQRNLLCLYFVNNENLTPLCINNYLRGVNFTDSKLNLIKTNIDELSQEFSNSDQLFKKLLSKLAEDEEAKKTLTDLIYSVEDKKELNFQAIEQYIKDHIAYLKTYQVSEKQTQLKAEYYADNNDDMTSIQHQQRVRDLIKQRKSELSNSTS